MLRKISEIMIQTDVPPRTFSWSRNVKGALPFPLILVVGLLLDAPGPADHFDFFSKGVSSKLSPSTSSTSSIRDAEECWRAWRRNEENDLDPVGVETNAEEAAVVPDDAEGTLGVDLTLVVENEAKEPSESSGVDVSGKVLRASDIVACFNTG